MRKKLLALLLVLTTTSALLAGCGSKEETTTTEDTSKAQEEVADEGKTEATDGSVYYLNFKPEQAEQWEGLAKKIYRANRR